MELRPYQADCIEALRDSLRRGARKALVVMPTATGKTVVFAEIITRHLHTVPTGHALILAHRTELLRQAKDKVETQLRLRGVYGDVSMIQAGAPKRPGLTFGAAVTIASVASLSRESRLEHHDTGRYTLIIIDEAHHATAKTYRRILERFPEAIVIGVTATPDRADKTGLKAIFEEVAYSYDIRAAIEDEYLVPVRARHIDVIGVDMRRVRKHKGDFKEADLEREFLQQISIESVAKPLITETEGRRTIVFCSGVRHALAVAEALNAMGGHAVAVHGKTAPEIRDMSIDAFATGGIQYLVNCNLFTEGTDIPSCGCIAIIRPTRSRSLYTQMVGRGFRLHGATLEESRTNEKPDLLLLDFVGASSEHTLCVDIYDVLEGDSIGKEVKSRAKKIAKDTGADATEAIKEARFELAAEERNELLSSVEYNTTELDPFALLGVPRNARRFAGTRATDAQKSALVRSGIAPKVVATLTKGDATEMLGAMIKRREERLCTIKQAQQLAKHGITTRLSFEDASKVIDYIASHNWRVSRYQVQSFVSDILLNNGG